MIKGKLLIEFKEEHVSIEADLALEHGTADKCFIIENVCKALRLEGAEKRAALLAVAAESLMSKENKE